MICYKDMTFCSFNNCKAFNTCKRALTKKVIKNATIWWNNKEAPICQYVDKPECFKKEKK